jgi:adenylate cyclase
MANAAPLILLVDDDSSNLFLLEELLLCEGYTSQLAASGTEALAIAATSLPDLILLDVMMPEMDGFEVCRRLREDVRLQGIPIIFLTALDDDDSRLRGLEMMGDDYLTKPINSRVLLAKIKSILRLNQMRSQQVQSEIKQLVKEQSRHQIAAAWEVNDYISEKFRLFVPEQFLNRIAPRGVESIQLGNANEEELTVLFCDIRGFTAIAESQSAMETFAWLNAFFTEMSQEIATHHGFVDKFLGDAILAVFDRPENHAEDAVKAAVAMQLSLVEFNRDRFQYNLNELIQIGVGIHTGIGLIGTVGSNQRMDSTVIGDVVNTASRLEELTKVYGCPILVSNTTIDYLEASYQKPEIAAISHSQSSDYPYRWVDSVTPRGKQVVIELYEVFGTPTQCFDQLKLQTLSCYNVGLQAWFKEDFLSALSHFRKVIDQNPADTIAQLYLERCQTRLGLMPPQNEVTWDGYIA